jgi:hypothetical protein
MYIHLQCNDPSSRDDLQCKCVPNFLFDNNNIVSAGPIWVVLKKSNTFGGRTDVCLIDCRNYGVERILC